MDNNNDSITDNSDTENNDNHIITDEEQDSLCDADTEGKKNNDTFTKSFVETLIYIGISIAIVLLLRAFVVQHVRVDGTSMNPTLQDNEHLLIEKLSYKFGEIQRFDIVVFRPYETNSDILYVKRVIGLPHETVYIENNSIYVDGKVLVEDYGGDTVTEPKDLVEPITLGDDEYFVLGDNRTISQDSRSTMVGKVSGESIIGKAWFVIYPFDRIGSVKHE